MATAPIPAPSIVDLLTKGIDIKFNVTGSLPGESIIAALIAYCSQVRATMDPALMKRLDAVTVQQIEDVQHVWRGIWQTLGVIPR
jgi:hypothetical protein